MYADAFTVAPDLWEILRKKVSADIVIVNTDHRISLSEFYYLLRPLTDIQGIKHT